MFYYKNYIKFELLLNSLMMNRCNDDSKDEEFD